VQVSTGGTVMNAGIAHWLGKKTKNELIKLVYELHTKNLAMMELILEEEE
jgi:hypothetical protein